MARNSKIEWTDASFNPWWGCSRVSPACAHCYAEAFAHRLNFDVWSRHDGHGERRTFSDSHWLAPVAWNAAAQASGSPVRVFCASMADVFEDHPTANVERPKLWDLIRDTPWLDWQLLTKRPQNIARMLPDDWGDDGWRNVWLGTTVENHRWRHHIDEVLKIPAAIHFVSCEPLLGEVDLMNYLPVWSPPLPVLDWVIVGGESGPKARPMGLAWARSLRDQCAGAGVPYFFKQMGGRGAKDKWAPIPEDLQVREFPITSERPSLQTVPRRAEVRR